MDAENPNQEIDNALEPVADTYRHADEVVLTGAGTMAGSLVDALAGPDDEAEHLAQDVGDADLGPGDTRAHLAEDIGDPSVLGGNP